MAMDKNLAALLREDVVTIGCVFHSDEAREEHIEQHLVWPVGADPNVVEEAKRTLKTKRPPGFRIQPGATVYTFVAPIAWNIQPGDTVIVETAQGVRLVKCARVDDKVEIQPNADIEYKWVVARVDMAPYRAELQKNKDIEDSMAEAYKRRMRRSYKDSVLNELEGEDREKLAALLAPAKASSDDLSG